MRRRNYDFFRPITLLKIFRQGAPIEHLFDTVATVDARLRPQRNGHISKSLLELSVNRTT